MRFHNYEIGILFVDARSLGSLIEGSRKQKELAPEEIERIASVYREFKREGRPEAVPGFCAVATVEEVAEHHCALTPGRYVGAEEVEEEGEPFEVRRAFASLVTGTSKSHQPAGRRPDLASVRSPRYPPPGG